MSHSAPRRSFAVGTGYKRRNWMGTRLALGTRNTNDISMKIVCIPDNSPHFPHSGEVMSKVSENHQEAHLAEKRQKNSGAMRE